MRRAIGAAIVLSGLLSAAALAGEQYVDETGYAVSGYDVVAYHGLNQAPLGQAQPAAVKGSTTHVVEYNGAKWAFSTARNADLFRADPQKFVPRYDGHCAYGVAKGGKVPANPNLWRIVDGKLYFNITPTVAGIWTGEIAGNIGAADTNWQSVVEDKPASDRRWTAIVENEATFDGSAPLEE